MFEQERKTQYLQTPALERRTKRVIPGFRPLRSLLDAVGPSLLSATDLASHILPHFLLMITKTGSTKSAILLHLDVNVTFHYRMAIGSTLKARINTTHSRLPQSSLHLAKLLRDSGHVRKMSTCVY